MSQEKETNQDMTEETTTENTEETTKDSEVTAETAGEVEEKEAVAEDKEAVGEEKMLGALDEIGVKPIEAVGQEFDPNFHNAVMTVESEDMESGTVAEELQKGYMYQDSVVRHSMVKVVS